MKTIIFWLFIAFVSGLFAKNKDSTQSAYARTTAFRYQNYLGFAGGMITGSGLSYRRWAGDNWAWQINILPLYKETRYPQADDYIYPEIESGYSNEGTLSFGITYLREIAGLRFFRFVIYSGTNLYTNYKEYDYVYNEPVWSDAQSAWVNRQVREKDKRVENKISLGGGGGAEFFVWRFSLHAMVGFLGSYILENKAKEIGPSVEGGIHFRF